MSGDTASGMLRRLTRLMLLKGDMRNRSVDLGDRRRGGPESRTRTRWRPDSTSSAAAVYGTIIIIVSLSASSSSSSLSSCVHDHYLPIMPFVITHRLVEWSENVEEASAVARQLAASELAQRGRPHPAEKTLYKANTYALPSRSSCCFHRPIHHIAITVIW